MTDKGQRAQLATRQILTGYVKVGPHALLRSLPVSAVL